MNILVICKEDFCTIFEVWIIYISLHFVVHDGKLKRVLWDEELIPNKKKLRQEEFFSLIRLVYLFVCAEMLRRLWNRKEEDEYASGGNNPPTRLSSRTFNSEVADHIIVCEILRIRKCVGTFEGRLRWTFESIILKMEQIPSNKGISLMCICGMFSNIMHMKLIRLFLRTI